MRATPFSAIPFSTTPFSTVPLSAIPFSALLLIPALAGAGPPPTRYPPDALLSPLTPAVTAHLRAIAARQPRREDVFAKVGCSITASPRFMRCLAEDEADLGPFERLWPALVHFGGGDAAGTDPFRRVSKAAWPGWSVANVLAGGDHSPLEAELSALDPRFALVMFGTNDIERGDVADFGRRLWRLVDRLTDGGVIPILSTIPPRADRPLVGAEVARYNGVIRGLAQGRRVPLIDLNRALRFLPGAGLTRDGVHLDTFRREKQLAACDFTEAALKHGYNTRNLLNLAARVVRGGQILAAILDPLDGRSDPFNAPGEQRLLCVDVALEAECSADIRDDHPQSMLGPAELLGDEAPGQVRALARSPKGDPIAVPVRNYAAWLHWHARDQVVVDRSLNNDVGLREAGLEITPAQRPFVAAIRTELGVRKGAVVPHRCLNADDRIEWLVVDDHGFRRILGGVPVLGDHHRDRRTDTRNAVSRKRPPLGDQDLGARRAPGTWRGLGKSAQVRTGEHGTDTRELQCRRGVDRDQAGVGLARADECRMELALDRYVIEEAAAAAKQPGILAPAN